MTDRRSLTSEFKLNAVRMAERGDTAVRPARFGGREMGTAGLALTKIDMLDDLDRIPVCVGCRNADDLLGSFPTARATVEVGPERDSIMMRNGG